MYQTKGTKIKKIESLFNQSFPAVNYTDMAAQRCVLYFWVKLKLDFESCMFSLNNI